MDKIASWFRYAHIIIPILTIGLIYFIYAMIRHINTKKPESSSPVLQKPTKYLLFGALGLSYTYLLTTTFQTIFMFIPYDIFSYSSFWCPYFASYRFFSYTMGRSILYIYFLSRTNDLFKGTYLQFSRKTILTLLLYLLTYVITAEFSLPYIYLTMQQWDTISDVNADGTYCTSTDTNQSATDLVKYSFLWGSANDLSWAMLTMLLMVSKLFSLIIESENNSKSRHARFSINEQLSQISVDAAKSTSNQHAVIAFPVPPTSPTSQTSPAATNNDENDGNLNDDHVSSLKHIEINSIGSIASIGSINDVQINLPTPDPDQDVITPHRSCTADSTTMSLPNFEQLNDLGTISKKQTIDSKSDTLHLETIENKKKINCMEFHKKTEDQNHIILLMSKFFILLSCIVVSSQSVLMIFLLFPDMVLVLYSIDTFSNIVCLYLTFKFTENYYYKYLCGKWCTKVCFPLVKTITLQCSAYERHYRSKHNVPNDKGNKCCIYCKCCCYGYCMDDKINYESSREVHKLAKFEIELMVTGDIKSNSNVDLSSRR